MGMFSPETERLRQLLEEQINGKKDEQPEEKEPDPCEL